VPSGVAVATDLPDDAIDLLAEVVAVENAGQARLLLQPQQPPVLQPGAAVPHLAESRTGTDARRVERDPPGDGGREQRPVQSARARPGDDVDDHLADGGPPAQGDPGVEDRPVVVGDGRVVGLVEPGGDPRRPAQQVQLVGDAAHPDGQAHPAVEHERDAQLPAVGCLCALRHRSSPTRRGAQAPPVIPRAAGSRTPVDRPLRTGMRARNCA
jgi:hypothetical protein